AGLDSLAAELLPQGVNRALGKGPLARLHVHKVGRVRLAVVGEVRNANSEQPVLRAIDLPPQKLQSGRKDAVGQLRGIAELAVAGTDPEVSRFQLEHDRTSGHSRPLQP